MVVTTPNAVELVQAIEQADSPARLVSAVKALADARLPAGIPALITALGYNNPEAAMAAVTGLVQLGDLAVPLLLEKLDDYNYGARAYSFRALAAIADPRALEVLCETAETDFAPSVRRAAIKGLGGLRWSQLPPEQQQMAQTQALNSLLRVSEDSDWAIRYAAVVGLQALAASLTVTPGTTELYALIRKRFSLMDQGDPDLAVRARVWLAQQQLAAPCS